MTPESQRIAIAEACGMKVRPDGSWYRNDKFGMEDGSAVPFYLSDLNTMHEAEKVIPDDKKVDYINQLYFVTYYGRKLTGSAFYDRDAGIVFATAAQRAEAFLRTLNLWQD